MSYANTTESKVGFPEVVFGCTDAGWSHVKASAEIYEVALVIERTWLCEWGEEVNVRRPSADRERREQRPIAGLRENGKGRKSCQSKSNNTLHGGSFFKVYVKTWENVVSHYFCNAFF